MLGISALESGVHVPDDRSDNLAAFRCAFFEGRLIRLGLYHLDELENAPQSAGLYCWVYVPANIDDLALDVTWPASLRAGLDGPLGFRYSGLLRPCPPTASSINSASFELLRVAMFALAAPLYIGMATNLRARLLAHRTSIRSNPRDADPTDGEAPSDTDAESRQFGRRIARLLADKKIRDASLFVRCTVFPRASRTTLKRIETVLNRMYTPAQGRKA
ncbi:MAG: GIY-YIG nuclease family protein [Deltaproteobacteria bacterium]|nr:GIY-YIG nuclease family protein [Deltaproteobacteria bacterium]